MNGRSNPFRRALLAFGFLSMCMPNLVAQATLPTATALRSYDKGFREPVRLASDPEGRLYVADPRMGLITIRDEAGQLLAVKRGFAKPLGLALDASGRIFVCESGKGRVSIFTPGWVPAGFLGQGDGEFQMPNHITITPDGTVYVVDSAANLVKVFGSDGVLIRQFGGFGRLDGQLNFPTGLAVTPAGEIFVFDQQNERMQVFDASGAFLRKFGGPLGMAGSNTTFGRVQGLLTDAQGRIYLADSFRGVVVVVDATGKMLGNIGAFGSDPGQLTGPASLVLDRNNRLFVAAPGNTRVEVFGLDTYTDPHILFADLTVSPTDLSRDGKHVKKDKLRHDDHEDEDEDDDHEGDRVKSKPDHPKKEKKDKHAKKKRRDLVEVLIRVSGVDPSAIQEGSLIANGIRPTHVPGAFIGDFDGDGNFEFRAWFNKNRLVATMPDGEAFLVLNGRLSDGRTFESIAHVNVLNLTEGVQ